MDRRRFLRLAPPRGATAPASTSGAAARAAAALATYEQPLSRTEARHLVTRLEFGARLRRVNGFIGMTPTEAVDTILQEAEDNALPEPPRWYKDKRPGDTEDLYGMQRDWLYRMREQGFIERITLFWHNHLVIQHNKTGIVPYHVYTYYKLLRTYALGNFKELIRRIGIDPAMLIYLDGNGNRRLNDQKGSNENYARELLELFTMGITGPDGSPNYLEEDNGPNDVRQISRVLTGWQVEGFAARPNRLFHDSGDKQIFGKTFAGSEDPLDEYNRFIDFLFAERGPQIAHYICRKFYVFFVDPIPDEAFVAQLAQVFLDHDFEIKPVLRTLFLSRRFYEPGLSGCRIKSPVDFLVGFLNETETSPSREVLEYFRQQLEPARLAMELFNPPNVAGWPGLNPPDSSGAPGDETWITTGLLPERWNILTDLITGQVDPDVFDPVKIAIRVSDPSNPFAIAEDLAQAMMPVPLEYTSIRATDEPFEGDMMIPPPQEVLDDPTRSTLSKLLLNGTPWYDWPTLNEEGVANIDGARTLLREYLAMLSREMPEYQLH